MEERGLKDAGETAAQKNATEEMKELPGDEELPEGGAVEEKATKTEPVARRTEEPVVRKPAKKEPTRPPGTKTLVGSRSTRAAAKPPGRMFVRKAVQPAEEAKPDDESAIRDVALKKAKEHLEHGMLLRNQGDFRGALRHYALARNGGISAQVIEEAVEQTSKLKREAEEQAAEAEKARGDTAARLIALEKAEEHFRYADRLRRTGDFNGALRHLALAKSGGVPAPIVDEAIEQLVQQKEDVETGDSVGTGGAADDRPGRLTFRKVRIPTDPPAKTVDR